MARLEWVLCWLAYRLVLVLPHTSKAFFKLLPHAGIYAYSEDGYEEYRERRTGFCTMAPRA